MPPDRSTWVSREGRLDVVWAIFSLANLVAMLLVRDWETVPFHLIWVSLTLVYGFRVWNIGPTLTVLAVVVVGTSLVIGIEVARGVERPDEFTEVPLMAAVFLVMVWHARRRVTAMEEIERVSSASLRLLERERRFVQDASHELRTPITVALGHAGLVQRRVSDPLVAEDAAVIADELMRLRRLADRLLVLAGTEDPEFLHRKPVDLETVVVDTIRRWSVTPRRWLLENGDEVTVLADPERLSVAFDALIENAVNHTQVHDTIKVALHRRCEEAIVSIHDSGTGIPAADLERIFDRFARADPGRSRHTGGFGLGLPIVRAIVEAHGGTIHVESSEGAGTTFEIRFPLEARPVGEETPRTVELGLSR